MIRKLKPAALLLTLAASAAAQEAPKTPAPSPSPQAAPARQQAPAPPKTHLKVGDLAPDFTLIDTERKQVKLSDFRGKKNVVLAFYTLAFTGG